MWRVVVYSVVRWYCLWISFTVDGARGGGRPSSYSPGADMETPSEAPEPQYPAPLPMKSLNLWIGGEEVEQFVGVPMDIYVIREGVVVPYLKDAYIDNQLPVLPPDVNVVKLTWQATDDLYRYEFRDMRSLDPHTLYNPLISIPMAGYIPIDQKDFQMTIPCTRRVTAIASMYISLYITNSRGRFIPGCPIKIHLRKSCFAYEERSLCDNECQHGGTCNQHGLCECKPGYLGQSCQQVACLPECQNNGTCTSPGKCRCMEGYMGKQCQTPVCEGKCQHGGACVGPDQCACMDGYYGNQCQHKTGSCLIPCKNMGICSQGDTCICTKGYSGEFCQKASCRRSCGVHGRCVAHNVCGCQRGWRGRFCHKTVNRSTKKLRAREKRRKRRKDPLGFWHNRRQRTRRLRKRDRRRRLKKATKTKSV